MIDVVATNAEILLALRMFETVGPKKVPNVKANYALTKARRKFGEAAKDLDATRLSLCEQYAHKNEDGTAKHTTVKNDLGQDVDGFDLEDQVGFATAYNALLAISVTVEGVRAVTLDELEGTDLTLDELAGLGPLVTE